VTYVTPSGPKFLAAVDDYCMTHDTTLGEFAERAGLPLPTLKNARSRALRTGKVAVGNRTLYRLIRLLRVPWHTLLRRA